MIAKYIVLSNIISFVSDKILHICIKEPLLILKKIIVLLNALSAYNNLLVRYKVYSSDPRECLCKGWRYAKAYGNFSIDPAPCRKSSIKTITHTGLRFQIGVKTSSVHMEFHFDCISKRYFDGLCRHFLSGSVYMIFYCTKWNFISVKKTYMKSIPALSFKRMCALNATSSESALIHFVSGKLCSHENLMPV